MDYDGISYLVLDVGETMLLRRYPGRPGKRQRQAVILPPSAKMEVIGHHAAGPDASPNFRSAVNARPVERDIVIHEGIFYLVVKTQRFSDIDPSMLLSLVPYETHGWMSPGGEGYGR